MMKSEPQGSKATERSITRMLSKLIKHEQPLSSWREQSFSETPPIVELTRKQAQQNDKKDDSSMTKTQTLSASSHRSSVCSSSENTKSHKIGEKGKLKSAKKIQHKRDVVDSNKKVYR
ncbi:unnamed protein product [Anisakis simplex]|uniref:Ovule protein n=1 Tax=Anisakis simplex TaxID=6269 RepID=A0A0M3JHX0_ANISI|nr:unnamed protein product [Anisakis simplex]